MDKVLYVVAIACAVAAFIRGGHSTPNSPSDIEAASLFALAPLLAVGGLYIARKRRKRPPAAQ